MTNAIAEKSSIFHARLAGFGLLLMFVLAIFANFFVIQGLIIPGDSAATANNIITNEMLFRSGITSFIIVLILDVLVAWSLYVLLKHVNKNLSLLAAWFRLIYTAIFGAALFNLLSVLQLLSGVDLEMEHIQTEIMLYINAFNNGWIVGLVFFGLHLTVLGFLIFKSSLMPRILGILVVIASLGYLLDSFAKILLSNYTDYQTIFILIVAISGVTGELSLAIWLLFKGKKT